MTSNTPTEEGSEQLRWHFAFALLVLLASAGVIALVWVWMGFPGRADIPGWWPRTLTVTAIVLGLIGPAVWLLMQSQPKTAPTLRVPPTPRWWMSVGLAGTAGLASYLAWNAQGPDRRRDLLWGLFYAVGVGSVAIAEAIGFVRVGGRSWPRDREWSVVALFVYFVVTYFIGAVDTGQRALALAWLAIPMGAVGGCMWLGRKLK